MSKEDCLEILNYCHASCHTQDRTGLWPCHFYHMARLTCPTSISRVKLEREIQYQKYERNKWYSIFCKYSTLQSCRAENVDIFLSERRKWDEKTKRQQDSRPCRIFFPWSTRRELLIVLYKERRKRRKRTLIPRYD